ncbi:M20 family metallopeptidase [Thalassospira sp. MA62]|nr:M20 family metallopeptidase [Thalassospira sp. MA62]
MSNTKIDAVELTRQLIRFETINPINPERDCVEYVGSLLSEHGFETAYYDFAPGRTNLIARIGGQDDRLPLCFTGHLDTVPLGHTEWSEDPFSGDIKDDKLFGRGSSDMKSGVAAFVTAMIDMADVLADGPGVVLLITAGEETGCEGASYLASLDGIIGKAGAIVVAEPTSNYPYVGHKGALWMTARTDGVTAHGSMPELGVNAIYKAARAVTKLEDFDFNIARHPVMGPATLNVGTIDGGININSVPNRSEFGIDVRTIPGQDNNAIFDHLASYLGDDVTLTAKVNLEPVWTSPDDPWMQSVFTTVQPIIDTPIENKTAAYFTDASIFTRALDFAPTLILGPGEASMAHQTDEFCYVSRIHQAVEIYRELATNWNNA